MSKPLLQLAALGLFGLAIWKVGSFFLLPLIFLALKIAFVVALVLFAIWFFKRNDTSKDEDKAAG